MDRKLLSGLFVLLLITVTGLPSVVQPVAQGMGMGRRHHRGMGPMMGGGRSLGENPVAPTVESIASGKGLYQVHCQVCHGPRARGDGPAAAGLNPRPPDLVRSAKLLSDGVLAGVIAEGRGAMPSFKATLTQSKIWDLTNFVKSLGR